VPEDLVGEDIADAGHERLIHQSCLHASSTAPQQVKEVLASEGQRVRAERSEHRSSLLIVVGEPDSAQLAHVPIAKLPAVLESDDEAIVAVPLRLLTRPDQIPRHAEMQEEGRPVGWTDQPLPSPIGFVEGSAAQRTLQVLGCGVPDDGRVHPHLLDLPPRGVPPEEAAICLDVWKLRHAGSLAPGPPDHVYDGRSRGMTDVKGLHARALRRYGELVHAIRDDQWHGPTPCSEWDVRVLVNHLVSENLWMPPLLEGKTISEVGSSLDGDLLGEDPKAAWDHSAEEASRAVQAIPLEGTVHLSYGETPVEHYISEVFMDLTIHAWDLARAIGADEAMDPEAVDLLYERYKPIEDGLKASGLFGPKVDPPPGSDKQTQLLAVFGRVA
jgi:uncharacterized protein (TIGR03086 family)